MKIENLRAKTLAQPEPTLLLSLLALALSPLDPNPKPLSSPQIQRCPTQFACPKPFSRLDGVVRFN